jgi:hypothetical protein
MWKGVCFIERDSGVLVFLLISAGKNHAFTGNKNHITFLTLWREASSFIFIRRLKYNHRSFV